MCFPDVPTSLVCNFSNIVIKVYVPVIRLMIFGQSGPNTYYSSRYSTGIWKFWGDLLEFQNSSEFPLEFPESTRICLNLEELIQWLECMNDV